MIRLADNLQLNMQRPWALYAAFSFLLILILFFLHRRWRKVQVPSFMFWRDILQEKQVRKTWRRLARIFSLLIWLLIVLGATLSATGPELEEVYQAPMTIFVLDNSLSMMAEHGTGSRLDAAKQFIADYSQNAHPDAEWVLIRTAPGPALVQARAGDAALFLQAVSQTDSVHSSGQMNLALHLAKQYQQDREQATEILLLTDAADMNEVPEGVRMIVFNQHQNNAALTGFHVRQDPYYLYFTASVELKNASFSSLSGQLALLLDGKNIGSKPWTLKGGEGQQLTFELGVELQGLLEAVLLGADGGEIDSFTVDNRMAAYIPRRQVPRVVLVIPDGNVSLMQPAFVSLQSMIPMDEGIRSSPEGFEEIKSEIRDSDLVIFEGCSPLGELPKGNFLLLNCDANFLPFELGETAPVQSITLENPTDPLMRFLALQQVHIQQARRVALKESMTVFLSSGNSPLLFSYTNDERNLIYLAFDLRDSNFVLLDSFPMFMANVLRGFSVQYRSAFASSYACGESIQPLGRFEGTVMVHRYEGKHRRQSWAIEPDEDGQLVFSETGKAGQYYFQVGERVLSPAAVNFSAFSESILDTRLAGLPPKPLSAPVRSSWIGFPLQRALIVFVLLAVLLEWVLFSVFRMDM